MIPKRAPSDLADMGLTPEQALAETERRTGAAQAIREIRNSDVWGKLT